MTRFTFACFAALTLAAAAGGCEKKQIMGHAAKAEWHPSCQVAAIQAPHYFHEPLKFSKRREYTQHNQTGECTTRMVIGNLWFVQGTWYNDAMKEDRIAPVNYEAVMYADNNPSEIAVERYGTQYNVCSIAIDGIDRTGEIRLNKCGDGRYILEFKKKHGL